MATDLAEPHFNFRPYPFLRVVGAAACFAAALPSMWRLIGFALGHRDGNWIASMILCLLLTNGFVSLGLRWWNLSAELGPEQLIMRGPFLTRRFPYSNLGNIRRVRVESWAQNRRRRRDKKKWKLVDRNDKPIASVDWIILLGDKEEFVEALRNRIRQMNPEGLA